MSTYSTNLKIELIGTGEQAGTWGVTTDSNFSNVFEQSIVGQVGVSFSDADVTLTATNSVSSQSFRNVYLNCTGTNTASRNLIVPTINKNYVVQNNTTGGFPIVVKTSAGTGITVPNGKTVAVYADGTNVIQAFDYIPSGSFGALTVSSLTDTGLTSGRVTYATTGGLLTDSANMTFDGSTLTTLNSAYTGTLTGGTGVINIGSGQFYKDASGNVGIGLTTPTVKLTLKSASNVPALRIVQDTNSNYGWSYQAESTTGGLYLNRFSGGSDTATYMVVDTSGNVGIGTSSPTQRLTVFTSGSNFTTLRAQNGTSSFDFAQDPNGEGLVGQNGAYAIRFATNASERMRIDSSGNVGIGTSSPAAKLHVLSSGLTVDAGTAQLVTRNDGPYISIGHQNWAGTSYAAIGGTVQDGGGNTRGVMRFFTRNTTSDANLTEAMRIDSSGNLLVGTTSGFGKIQCNVNSTTLAGGFFYQLNTSSSSLGSSTLVVRNDYATGTNNAYMIAFQRADSGYSGSITSSGTVTVYNTTSDYRLKTVIGKIADAGTRIDALQPIEYDWNIGGRTRGFLAHQFAEVYPNSVSGEKDAVDAEGKPVYQGMQASTPEVMADLIAEIQSLRKRVAQLESK